MKSEYFYDYFADRYVNARNRFQELQKIFSKSHSIFTLLSALKKIKSPKNFVSSTLKKFKSPKDLLITHIEVNCSHGVGILLNRIFDPHTCVTIKSRKLYPEPGPFQAHWIDALEKSRGEIFSLVWKILSQENIKHIICVPYFKEDYLIGIAAKNLLGVPLVVWVMDDLIFNQSEVPESLAAELFRLADIRFVISPQMRDLYEERFRQKFYLIPPTAPASLIKQSSLPDISHNLSTKTCVMIGNIWSRTWLENLFQTIKESGWTVHWYGLGSAASWLNTSKEELKAHGIEIKGFLPENEFPQVLTKYPFAIIPTGCGTEQDDRKGITLLSLPSRVTYLLSVAHIPLLVIGSAKSCVSKFVQRFEVGISIDYKKEQFSAALKKLNDEAFLAQCHKNAAIHAKTFSDEGLVDWIWKSCKNKMPIDDRFEQAFQRQHHDLYPYVEASFPQDLCVVFREIYFSLRRLKQRGYQPDFIIDVGASSGIWSYTAHRLFPSARFILVEPLISRYDQFFYRNYLQFEWIIAAASNKNEKTAFQVSQDFYGSSLLQPEDHRIYHSIEIPTTTLDTVYKEKEIHGRGILKIDVQFAEHLVLEGASTLLEKVDILILELTLRFCPSGAKNFIEMINHVESLGFHYYDDVGEWRCPVYGTLIQKDVLFVKKSLLDN